MGPYQRDLVLLWEVSLGLGLRTEPRVPRVVRKNPPGVLVNSRRKEYDLFAREHLTPLAATVFNDRVGRMAQRGLAK